MEWELRVLVVSHCSHELPSDMRLTECCEEYESEQNRVAKLFVYTQPMRQLI
jgi:hypothetical protein